MTDISVTDNADEQQYEAHLGDQLAGFAQYRVDGDNIVFFHTVVDPAFKGQGIGGALARAALDDVRARGEHKVVAECPFIAKWIHRHPAYQDLLAA